MPEDPEGVESVYVEDWKMQLQVSDVLSLSYVKSVMNENTSIQTHAQTILIIWYYLPTVYPNCPLQAVIALS
jgi:hypothetical protein